MHGSLSDVEQQEIVEQFRQAHAPVRVLVTGDVASCMNWPIGRK